MNFFKSVRLHAFFVVPYAVLLIVLGNCQLLYSQGAILLAINRHYHPAADLFFKYITHLGDGIFCVAVGLGVLWVSRPKGILMLASYALSGIAAQLIKNFGFPREPRPAEYFSTMLQRLHTVPGVELGHWNSFPSGHTTSAFALFSLFALWVRPPLLKLLCFVAAATVAFSRMYLFQHFMVDVYAGALLGSATAWALVIFYEQRSKSAELRGR